MLELIKKDNLFELQYVKHNDDIWFRAKQVADILGYKNSNDAIIKHVDMNDKVKISDIFNPREMRCLKGNMKNSLLINESGLYALVLSSKLPSAKQFKNWVTKDVLPSIRRTGSYSIVDQKNKQQTNV